VRGQIVQQTCPRKLERLDAIGFSRRENDDGDVVQVAQVVPEAWVKVKLLGCDNLEAPPLKEVCTE